MICRSQKLDYALVSSLERDPLLKERLRRLRTVPGVGPITALTWASGRSGDVTRFTSIKQAISYCGLCGDEKSSADKAMRMPISKQRNKHIQRVLIEAAKLGQHGCVTNSRKSVPKNWREETAIGPRWQLPGRWSAICSQWIAGIRTSCLPRSSAERQRLKNFSEEGEDKNIRIYRRAGCQVPP